MRQQMPLSSTDGNTGNADIEDIDEPLVAITSDDHISPLDTGRVVDAIALDVGTS